MQKDNEQDIMVAESEDNEVRRLLEVKEEKEDPPRTPGCFGIDFFDWSGHWHTAVNKESCDSLKKKLLPRQQSKVYTEGTPPRFGRPTIYDVRARPDIVESTLESKDLQMVKIGIRVLTRSGQNFNKGVLPSIIHEMLKAVVAEYIASELITQRETVSTVIKKVLTDEARNTGIPLDDVSITSLCLLAEEENDEKAGQDNTSTIIRVPVYTEGTPPRFGRPTIYDVRARPDFVESTLESKDLQMVKIGIRVLTRSGQNFNKGVLPSIIHETLKAVVAEYIASELITQRETVSTVIKKVLTDEARNTGILLDDVSITSLCLLAEEENDEKAGQDNTSTIIRAHGDDTWDKMQVYLTIALVVGLTILLMIQPFMPLKYLSIIIDAFATVWVLGSIALLLGLFGTNRYEREFSRHIGRLTFLCFCIFVLYVLYIASKSVKKGISSHASSPSSAPSETTTDGGAWFFITLGVLAVIGHTYSWVMVLD